MNEVLGVDKLLFLEELYLQVLVEVYYNVLSWDICRQVFLIMVGVVSFKDIFQYILGFMRYCFIMVKFY